MITDGANRFYLWGASKNSYASSLWFLRHPTQKKDEAMKQKLEIIKTDRILNKIVNIYGGFENPLFLAKDVAEWIEHTNITVMLKIVEDDEKVLNKVYTPGGNQETWFLTEDGLYEVLMQSNKPKAKDFKKQVKTLLKGLRKGELQIKSHLPDFTNPADAARAWALEYEKREKAENTVAILTHVKKTYTTTEIAKELGLRSAIELNKILEDKQIQYKVNGTWVLRADYSDLAYTETKQIELESGKIIYDTRWTQMGREFLLKQFDKGVVSTDTL